MHKDLFAIGPLTVHGYGLMIAIGIVAAVIIGTIRAKRRNLKKEMILDIALIAVIAGLMGAKILYIITDWSNFIKDPLEGLTEGFVVYGGIITGVLGIILYCRHKKVAFSDYFDIVMPSVAIAQGFGRIGCFLAGCCYGIEYSGPLCLRFPADSLAPSGVDLFPSQLVMAVGDFLIGIILILISTKMKYSGFTGALYLVLYPVGRFLIEFLRSDDRGWIGPFSTSQFISIIMIAAAAVLFLIFYKQKRPAALPVKHGGPVNNEVTVDNAEEVQDSIEGSEEEDPAEPLDGSEL